MELIENLSRDVYDLDSKERYSVHEQCFQQNDADQLEDGTLMARSEPYVRCDYGDCGVCGGPLHVALGLR